MVNPRAILILLWVGAAAPVSVSAQGIDPAEVQLWDVVRMEDGTVWRGVIVEHLPGRTYRLALPGGSVIVLDATRVESVTREPNPDYGGAAGTTWVPPMAASGMRFSVTPGVAVPTDEGSWDYEETIALEAGGMISARLGYEAISGSTGLTPAVFVEYARFASEGASVSVFHTGLQLRAAMHLGRFVPHAAVGFGADVAAFDADQVAGCNAPNTRCGLGRGFGMHFGFGSDILVTRRFALGFQFTIHPGITELAHVEYRDPYNGRWRDAYDMTEIGYFGIGLGASLY